MIGVSLNWTNTILSVVVSAGFIGGFLIAGWRWMHNQIINGVEERIGVVRQAVTPNGGSSMADAIKRIESKVDTLTQRQTEIKNELDSVRDDLDKLDIKFARHEGWHEGRDK